MPKLILIHGFAHSGKTTLMNQLKLAGEDVVSTSVELDHIVVERYNLPRAVVSCLQNKEDEVLQRLLQNDSVTCRSRKIETAEKWYIPKYGRKMLVQRAFYNQYIPRDRDYVFFETIGGEEAELVREVWKDYSDTEPININIRSSYERPGIDIREIACYGEQVWNNHFTPQDLLECFLAVLKANTETCVTN